MPPRSARQTSNSAPSLRSTHEPAKGGHSLLCDGLSPRNQRPAVTRLRSSVTQSDRNVASRSLAVLLAGAGLVVGGCAGQSSDPPADSDAPKTSVAAPSEAPASPAEANVIRELVSGDRGCYVRFE